MIELLPETLFAPLDLLATFGREAPLQVDLGCGDGAFLCELASQNPDRSFLGVEKLAGRVAKACRKSAHLTNVRVLHVESAFAVRHLLPETSVEAFYLFFPDPWPKRRHHRRRIVTTEFLDSIHRALAPKGILRIATDQSDYFHEICRLGREHSGFTTVHADNVVLPTTKFERRFVKSGAPIHRLALRKVSPVA
ncbi:MAG TPA: tRNA (guanosine(46)-N7)-methyltransferase TrmB [Chthoniobacterales bacterium]|nr:tRNA (guanosine(46)-N7)-methyltransferase TrmB [Chthoniobacterales bacterium]